MDGIPERKAVINPKVPRDVVGVARGRSAYGLEVSDRLEHEARARGSLVAVAQAARIRRCGDAGNIWTGNDLHREDTGEMYQATGNLWACGSKLCASCAAREAGKSRRAARAGVERLTVFQSFTCRFLGVTLTMPNDASRSAVDGINLINRAFRLLVNRQFWKSRVKGGIKGVEFTVTTKGKHVHIHALVMSDFMPVNPEKEQERREFIERRKLAAETSGNLNDEWRYCLLAVGIAAPETVFVGVQDARRRKDKETGKVYYAPLEKAVQETTKYLTKSESWLKVAGSDLVEMAEVERWPRMFELLGAAREIKLIEAGMDGNAAACLVHTQSLSAGDLAGISQGGEEEERESSEARSAERGRRPEAGGGCEAIKALSYKSSITRVPKWRELIKTMAFDEWLKLLDRQVRNAQKFRQAMLAKKYFCASFRTLAGDEFGVVEEVTSMRAAA
jgi:hypothetical protein